MKVAVSIPDSIFDAVERLAKQRHIPRSQIFADALEDYLSRHGSTAITATLNEVYTSEASTVDAPLAQAQLASIKNEAW